MKKIYRFTCILALVVSTFFEVQPAHAASTIIVNSLDDSIGVNGFCTLREAIQNANNNAHTNIDCIAGSGADTITFSGAGIGTITLGSMLPAITDTNGLTINGASQTVTISGNDLVQVMEVNSGASLTLTGLQIVHGHSSNGGGIANEGTLTIINSTFSHNGAVSIGGGIMNNGTLSISSSLFSFNAAGTDGGGIYNNSGTLNTYSSVFSDNIAFSHGGGIMNFATATIGNNSSFLRNRATLAGGGINNGGAGELTVINSTFSGNFSTSANGGGIYTSSGTDSVTGSTFSGNTASSGSGGGIFNDNTITVTTSTFNSNNTAINGGGIFSNGGFLGVTSTTFSGNSATNEGGGIANLGGITIANSTFSGNSAANNGGGIFSGAVTMTLKNSTLSGNTAVSGIGGGIAVIGIGGTLDYINTIIANSPAGGDCSSSSIGSNTKNLVGDNTCSPSLHGDPNLGPLANNGGSTQTFRLLPGSPAKDAGDDATCAASPVNNLDQRGVTRPQGSHCDIGAIEQGYPLYLPLIMR